MNSTIAEIQATNNRVYEDLIASLETAGEKLDLLISVCDDDRVQQAVIAGYEAELIEQGIQPFTITLQHNDPSLRTSLRELLTKEHYLQEQNPAVVTVLGANQLSTLALLEEQRSEQDIFFGYLQLTRDGLPQFPLSIVLWVSHQVAKQLATQAPDFWSWRGGVFWFDSYQQVTVSAKEIAELKSFLSKYHLELNQGTDSEYLIPINDLQKLIEDIDFKNKKDPKLGAFYLQLGEIYRLRCKSGKANNLQNEIALAERAYQISLERYIQLNDKQRIAEIYNNFGLLHESHNRYQEAITDYKNSIDWHCKASNQLNQGRSLKNLGNVHRALGQYNKAAELYQQSISIAREVGDRQTEGRALNTLGLIHFELAQYEKAIQLHRQHLDIAREVGNRQDEGHALGNLSMAYNEIGQHDEAIKACQQYIHIAKEVGDRKGEGNALCNLGNISYDTGRYKKAIELHQQSMGIAEEIGDVKGVGRALVNIGRAFSKLNQQERAVNCYRQSLSIAQTIGNRLSEAICHINLGVSLTKLHRGNEAIAAYEKAALIYDELGLMHEVAKIRKIISTAKIDNLKSASMTAPEIVPNQPKSSAVGRLVKRFWQTAQQLWQWLRHIFIRHRL